jgi:hypothetical protein
LALALDSKQAKTSFGKLPLSDEKSQPVFGFPQAKRDDADKMFMGELTKQNGAGKQSPGPIYQYQDEVKYQQVSHAPPVGLTMRYLYVETCVGFWDL